MKKLAMILCFALLGIGVAKAQHVVKKGDVMINTQLTQVGYNRLVFGSDAVAAADRSKNSRFGISGGGGYAVLNDLMVTASVAIQALDMDGDKASLLNIGAGVRKYFAQKFFAGANVGVLNLVQDDNKVNFIDGTVSIGMAMEMFPKFFLEPSLSFSTKLLGGEVKNMGETMTYNQLSVNLGFAYHF